MEIHEETRTITVIDYKTGKSARSWHGTTDYEKIKLHKYRHQLMMYKLLVENSRNFGGKYTVSRGILEFVEPDEDGSIQLLEATFNHEEMAEFVQLLQAVWRRIIALDLPNISQYSPTYKGMLEFEADLLK